MLPANTERERNTSSRSRSALERMAKPKKGEMAKKSRHAVESREQKTEGPKPRKRAVNNTAANKRVKRWRCSTGEKVQRLSATHTASAAPPYCTNGEAFFCIVQLFKLAAIPCITGVVTDSSWRSDLDGRGEERSNCSGNFSSTVDMEQVRIEARRAARGERNVADAPTGESALYEIIACLEICNRGWRRQFQNTPWRRHSRIFRGRFCR